MLHGLTLHNRHRTCAGVALLVSIFVLMLAGPARTACAVPHVISPVPHPYDPDWPEVYWILTTKCTGCHRPQSKQCDYTSYQSLLAANVDGMTVVEPGSPEDSLLWDYVSWNAAQHPDSDMADEPMMPEDKLEWLTEGQLATIERWIRNGARQFAHCQQDGCRPLLEIDFPSARQCAQCHPKQYREWSRSMHSYAQHSPVFEAFNQTVQERTSGTIGTFCTRCHTQLGTALGEKGTLRNVHRSRLAMEGVTCVTCHRRPFRHYKASTRVYIQPGKLLDSCVYGPFENPVLQEGTHPSAPLAYLRSSQFCGECHDVNFPTGVRLEEAFSEWQNSPAARHGITCQQCHMGPVQGIPIREDQRPLGRAAVVPGVPPEQLPLRRLADHTFSGPDYSLLPDTEFPHKLDWMYEVDYRNAACLTPYQRETLNQLRRRNRKQLKIATLKRVELLRNAASLHVSHPPHARAGQCVKIRADVTSLFAGHSFPTGFTAERQAWVSIEVRGPCGEVVFVSGDLDENHDLRDDHSHAVLAGHIPFDKHLLNFQSKFITLTNKGTERSVVIAVNRDLHPLTLVRPTDFVAASFGRPPAFRVAKGNLPPLKTLGKTYPVHLPARPGCYRVTAQLNFRNLPPTLLDHIGAPHLKHQLQVVVIDDYQGTILVR
jgi:hypothetical protein